MYILIDNLSITMAVYIAVLAVFILLFAKKNFEREERGNKWFAWFILSIASVLLLILSGDLLVILLGFILIGICLNRLLLSFPWRKRSQVLASKKFLVSRIGDLSFLLAIYFFYDSFQTFSITEAIEKISSMSANEKESMVFLPGLFLAVATLVKSAQFPFHFWLPETIEAPTPVSALMHAGIINAGGYLLVRMNFLYPEFGFNTGLVFTSGILTILLGGFAMLAQVDVKRKLAYSTLGQMGFMMVEFALGLYSLVILHIMGHGFYKAYGFLTSGNREIPAPFTLIPTNVRLVFGLMSLILPLGLFIYSGDLKLSMIALLGILLISFTPMNRWFIGIAVTILLVLSNFYLQNIGSMLLGSWTSVTIDSFYTYLITIAVLSIMGTFVVMLPLIRSWGFIERLYCYSQRGFLSEYLTDKLIKGSK